MTLRRTLDELFQHDERARRAETQLLSAGDRRALTRALTEAAGEALAAGGAAAEAKLERLAALLGQVPTKASAACLVEVLDSPSPAAREAAGVALVELSADHFEIVRKAIVEHVDGASDGPALEEIPFVVADIPHPDAVDLVLRLLAHGSTVVVAGALEVAGELGGDERVRRALEKLEGDQRSATIEDEDEGEVTLSIGEMATEVLEALQALDQREARR